MRINFTEEAYKQISEIKSPYIRLFYDTDGCGCAVNGIPTLKQEQVKEDGDLDVSSNYFSVIIHQKDATFFEEDMTLDYVNHVFRLKSPNGILNPVIPKSQLVKEG